MSLLRIITAPDPVLKQKSSPVQIVDDSVRKLMDDMLDTMYEGDGIGLAANQVGVRKRVIVLDMQEIDDQGIKGGIYPLHIANPEFLELSEEMVEAEEGCLSVPEQRIKVLRPANIKIKYLNYNNQTKTLSTGGLLARAIQHEIDHLDGKLLIDYLSNLKKDVALRKLRKLKKAS